MFNASSGLNYFTYIYHNFDENKHSTIWFQISLNSNMILLQGFKKLNTILSNNGKSSIGVL